MPKLVYLSLGSNLGDRSHYLDEALRLLQDGDLTVIRRSSLYETAPRDLVDQPWFLNLVAEVETSLFPRQLLARIKQVERRLGRRTTVDKGPRNIDIDILFFGSWVIDTRDLVIPHPRLQDRLFVLQPLAELAPDLRHPISKRSVRELIKRVSNQQVTKLT